LLLNGKADVMMYERGEIATDNLPFANLKVKAHLNRLAEVPTTPQTSPALSARGGQAFRIKVCGDIEAQFVSARLPGNQAFPRSLPGHKNNHVL
jgi:hypothetical protein